MDTNYTTLEQQVFDLTILLKPVERITTKHLKAQLIAAEKWFQTIAVKLEDTNLTDKEFWMEQLLNKKQEIKDLRKYIQARETKALIEGPLKKQKAREYYHRVGAAARRDREYFLKYLVMDDEGKDRKLRLDYRKSGMAKYEDYESWKNTQLAAGRLKDGVFLTRTKTEEEYRTEYYERVIMEDETHKDFIPHPTPTSETEQEFIKHRREGRDYEWNYETKELHVL